MPQRPEALGQPRTLAACHRRKGVVYGLEVIFPDHGDACAEHGEGWTLDFRAQPPQLSHGHGQGANVVHCVADAEDAAKRRVDHEISKLRDIRG